MKIIVINGPNLNMTGIREQSVYGTGTLEDINKKIAAKCEKDGIDCDFFQSNSEGALIDKIHSCHKNYDGAILNAGAYTHYSYAIRDAIHSVDTPFIEVHMSNVHAREEFRHTSVISPVCKGIIAGLGHNSYLLAVDALKGIINE